MDKEYAVESAKNDVEIFSLLSAFYNMNPDKQILDAIKAVDTDAIPDLEIKNAFIKMKDYASKAGDDEITSLKCDWTKLFRGVSPEYGPKPPYEELYGGKKSPEILVELASMYAETGYNFDGIANRPDYAGIELGYIAMLSALAVNAAINGSEAEYEKYTSLSESFIRRFNKWFDKFSREAEKYAETDFYRGVLELSRLMAA